MEEIRGIELGLSGGDLILYQVGEIVQIGVMIEKDLGRWIRDARLWQNKDRTKTVPKPLQAKIELADSLIAGYSWTPDQAAIVRSMFADVLEVMQQRNRVVHDQWLAFEERPGTITRFGYLVDPETGEGSEFEPGIGPGQVTHQDWEALRTRLYHAWWRLNSVHWVRPEPDGSFFYSDQDRSWKMVRGEFDLTRHSLEMRA